MVDNTVHGMTKRIRWNQANSARQTVIHTGREKLHGDDVAKKWLESVRLYMKHQRFPIGVAQRLAACRVG